MRQRLGELEHSGWAGRPGPAPGRRPDVSFLAPKDGTWSRRASVLGDPVGEYAPSLGRPRRAVWARPFHGAFRQHPQPVWCQSRQDSAVMAEFGSRPAPDDRWGPAGPDRSQTGQRSGAIVPRVVTVAVAR